ncbi:MAG: hypothetical protein EOP88_28580 [Verrucomicrobiaceae bacterium]|nr:MAG: hypothetical protein EOP88_28580 [Verrucomicrobiaceae bacterium]
MDDDRLWKIKTNTAASPVKDSHPQEYFSADLSVFQAHLPWHELYILRYTFCRSLWFDISSRAWIRDNAGPSASHRLMTRLTVESRAATVIAVEHSQSFSLDLLECRPIHAPPPVAAGGGVFHARVGVIWKSWEWIEWLDGVLRMSGHNGIISLNRLICRGKQKPRRLQERAGFSMKIDDRFRS